MNSRTFAGRAFTLVELLVVMAVISILAALLLPVLSKAIDSARTMNCGNHLRQIYLSGHVAYEDDHTGFIVCNYSYTPSAATLGYQWFDFGGLWNYLYPDQKYSRSTVNANRTVFTCPYKSPNYKTYGGYAQYYTLNSGLPDANGSPCGKPPNFRLVAKPSQALLQYECTNGTYWKMANSSGWGLPGHHNNGNNLLFCDGHQRWIRKSDIPKDSTEDKAFWTGQ